MDDKNREISCLTSEESPGNGKKIAKRYRSMREAQAQVKRKKDNKNERQRQKKMNNDLSNLAKVCFGHTTTPPSEPDILEKTYDYVIFLQNKIAEIEGSVEKKKYKQSAEGKRLAQNIFMRRLVNDLIKPEPNSCENQESSGRNPIGVENLSRGQRNPRPSQTYSSRELMAGTSFDETTWSRPNYHENNKGNYSQSLPSTSATVSPVSNNQEPSGWHSIRVKNKQHGQRNPRRSQTYSSRELMAGTSFDNERTWSRKRNPRRSQTYSSRELLAGTSFDNETTWSRQNQRNENKVGTCSQSLPSTSTSIADNLVDSMIQMTLKDLMENDTPRPESTFQELTLLEQDPTFLELDPTFQEPTITCKSFEQLLSIYA